MNCLNEINKWYFLNKHSANYNWDNWLISLVNSRRSVQSFDFEDAPFEEAPRGDRASVQSFVDDEVGDDAAFDSGPAPDQKGRVLALFLIHYS